MLATGTDRGNEVLAQAAARLDLPMVANCIDVRDRRAVRRDPRPLGRLAARGGHARRADAVLLTVALHAVDASRPATPGAGDAATVRRRRSTRRSPAASSSTASSGQAGITLATAPVVVGGGRGVGSAEGFAPLQELADLLGGVVGCSRAVTNNGWRNHTDQVGQTGTRIAPDVYFACGISGAIQHWVGAMAAKNIIAINTDPEANMVTKAGYAVIGDLHEVVPAISAEIRRRRGIS